MNYPKTTCYAWITDLKKTKATSLLFALIFLYLSINLFFGSLYYASASLGIIPSELDHYYFSFVTALTVGYGDLSPVNDFGKLLTIFQTCIMALYFALMVSILTAKIFTPKDTIIFSKKLVLNQDKDVLVFRLLNIHREKLVNPEIRILFTEHCHGNVISNCYKVEKIDDITYFGKHDFNIHFSNEFKNQDGLIYLKISENLMLARNYEGKRKQEEPWSRFKISISISGNYGMQQQAVVKNYYPIDIEYGNGFKSINYTNEDQREKGNIRYYKIPKFWNDFEQII